MFDGNYNQQEFAGWANDHQGISVTINKTDWTAPTVTGGAAGSGSTLLKNNIDEAIKSVTTERSKLGAIRTVLSTLLRWMTIRLRTCRLLNLVSVILIWQMK